MFAKTYPKIFVDNRQKPLELNYPYFLTKKNLFEAFQCLNRKHSPKDYVVVVVDRIQRHEVKGKRKINDTQI